MKSSRIPFFYHVVTASVKSVFNSSGEPRMLGLHSEKLKLFCLEDKQPVCLVCINSQKHDNHKFRPIDEVVSSYKEELNAALK
ncbi:hypothetical protein G5714_004112 [Onychostoma macrolepis]|uniref:B box-type domain-containing protein n=1 Tax=Onychostoma macrolepis TaxID=369639 RepID=A0A7J6DBE0_9TELE|nr:hypothetical protein G5714_004112 [Onychostoma macrolepis]